MSEQIDKTVLKRESSLQREEYSKGNGKQAISFVDNRPQSVAQRQLQAAADNDEKSFQLKAVKSAMSGVNAPIQLMRWRVVDGVPMPFRKGHEQVPSNMPGLDVWPEGHSWNDETGVFAPDIAKPKMESAIGLNLSAISNKKLPEDFRKKIIEDLQRAGNVSPTIPGNLYIDHQGFALDISYHIDFTGAAHGGIDTPHFQIVRIREAGNDKALNRTFTKALDEREIQFLLDGMGNQHVRALAPPMLEWTMGVLDESVRAIAGFRQFHPAFNSDDR